MVSFSFIQHNPAKDVPKEVNTFINKNLECWYYMCTIKEENLEFSY